MVFEVNKHIHEQNHLRAHAGEQFYIEQLEKENRLIVLDNIYVDAQQLVFRRFQCDTGWCLRCKKSEGGRQFKGSCCTDLQVDITDEEATRLVQLGRMAHEQLDLAASDPLYKPVHRMMDHKFTQVTDSGELAFGSLKSRRCPLSWVTPTDTLHCAINSLCDRLGQDLRYYKPEPCFLFPLHFVEHRPGKFFLTLICEETHTFIGADGYTAKLRCLSKPQPSAPPAYLALKGEIELCFGPEFYQALTEQAAVMIAANEDQED